MPTLLVIDDEPGVRLGIRLVLENQGIEVVEAQEIDEARRMIARHHPDVTLLDVQLGRSDGLALFEELHRTDKPVVVISGRGNPDAFERARQLGAFECLVKPLDITRLRQVVQRALERVSTNAPPAPK